MTREEAIHCLSVHSSTNGSGLCTDKQHYEAKQMAIKVLELEPSEDCISRENTLKAMIEQLGIRNEDYLIPAEATLYKVVKNMPPVTPQPEIVRCSQCKYAEVADSEDSQDGYTCQFHRGSIWFSGSYCSWAERRQDG